MTPRDKRLDAVTDDIDFVEENNNLTEHQREVILDFELLMIAAEMQDNTSLFSIYRYRLLLYLKSEDLKFRPIRSS